MKNRTANILAAVILLITGAVTIISMKNDSLTMDELAHLPAGYSYLNQQDMRLNPEHPPLIKDLAAVPLLFIKGIQFPSDIQSWKSDINGQWDFGSYFLFHSSNPTEQIIFWGRIPMVLILLLLGFYIFKWGKELFGNKAGLFALLLFSLCPTFLAHGKLVTTDIGAAAGVLIALYYFVKALKMPTATNIILAGVFFGLAQLCKFSVILLIPFFIMLWFFWWISKSGKLLQTLKIIIAVFTIGFLVIWPVYQFHVWNYPQEMQVRDIKNNIASYPDTIKNSVLWMAEKPILRPYAQYFMGLFMVFNRATSGNTTYFLGEISNQGWKSYFPIVYFIKNPLPLHIFSIIAIIFGLYAIKKPFNGNPIKKLLAWIKFRFPEFSMLAFIGTYWAATLTSNLNLGIRHLAPIFPLTFLLVGYVVMKWMEKDKLKYVFVSILILWQTFSVASVFPNFIAYFNELAGGAKGGYAYAVDSNLDWGQDLKRLRIWIDQKNIDKVYVDYFGGSDLDFYLGDKYIRWSGNNNPNQLPKGSYLAISATFLQEGRGINAPGFNQSSGFYCWLNKYEPVERIGYSIFVYKID